MSQVYNERTYSNGNEDTKIQETESLLKEFDNDNSEDSNGNESHIDIHNNNPPAEFVRRLTFMHYLYRTVTGGSIAIEIFFAWYMYNNGIAASDDSSEDFFGYDPKDTPYNTIIMMLIFSLAVCNWISDSSAASPIDEADDLAYGEKEAAADRSAKAIVKKGIFYSVFVISALSFGAGGFTDAIPVGNTASKYIPIKIIQDMLFYSSLGIFGTLGFTYYVIFNKTSIERHADALVENAIHPVVFFKHILKNIGEYFAISSQVGMTIAYRSLSFMFIAISVGRLLNLPSQVILDIGITVGAITGNLTAFSRWLNAQKDFLNLEFELLQAIDYQNVDIGFNVIDTALTIVEAYAAHRLLDHLPKHDAILVDMLIKASVYSLVIVGDRVRNRRAENTQALEFLKTDKPEFIARKAAYYTKNFPNVYQQMDAELKLDFNKKGFAEAVKILQTLEDKRMAKERKVLPSHKDASKPLALHQPGSENFGTSVNSVVSDEALITKKSLKLELTPKKSHEAKFEELAALQLGKTSKRLIQIASDGGRALRFIALFTFIKTVAEAYNVELPPEDEGALGAAIGLKVAVNDASLFKMYLTSTWECISAKFALETNRENKNGYGSKSSWCPGFVSNMGKIIKVHMGRSKYDYTMDEINEVLQSYQTAGMGNGNS